jgi:hypothetical protein
MSLSVVFNIYNILDYFTKDLINKHEYTIFEYNDIYQNCIIIYDKNYTAVFKLIAENKSIIKYFKNIYIIWNHNCNLINYKIDRYINRLYSEKKLYYYNDNIINKMNNNYIYYKIKFISKFITNNIKINYVVFKRAAVLYYIYYTIYNTRKYLKKKIYNFISMKKYEHTIILIHNKYELKYNSSLFIIYI